MNDSRLEKIEYLYNPDSDMIPGGPAVTWAEYLLASMCDDLLYEVDALKKRVDELEVALQQKEAES